MTNINTYKRILWLAVGVISLVLGVIGIVLPLLPTTPFILAAAFCFSQSSERCHQWIINHKTFGKLIRNWQEYGAINLNAKIISTVFITSILALSIIMDIALAIILIQALVLGSVLIFIWSRPLPPRNKKILKKP